MLIGRRDFSKYLKFVMRVAHNIEIPGALC